MTLDIRALRDLNFAFLIAEGIARDLCRHVTREELELILRKLGSAVEQEADIVAAWNEAIAEIKANERRN